MAWKSTPRVWLGPEISVLRRVWEGSGKSGELSPPVRRAAGSSAGGGRGRGEGGGRGWGEGGGGRGGK